MSKQLDIVFPLFTLKTFEELKEKQLLAYCLRIEKQNQRYKQSQASFKGHNTRQNKR